MLACAGILSLSVLALVGVGSWTVQAQSTDKATILFEVNRLRLANGLAPLAFNPALENAAQRHSDDMAAKGFVDHVGSDSSTPQERISVAGYPGWSSAQVVAEAVYAGNQGFGEALDFLMRDEAQLRILLNPRFREIGIGVGSAANGAAEPTVYWTLTFGAQPNVLPVFINDGALLINSPQAAIRLTQEEAVPSGEGNAMGSVIEIRIGTDPAFEGVEWQKWEALLPYNFDDTPGLKTLYVQLRDGGGRSTISTASVQYDPNSTPQVMPIGPGMQITPAMPLDALEISPTPFATLAPMQTVPPPAAGQPGIAATAIVVVITPQGTAVYNPTPTVSPTPQARPLVDRPDTTLPEWLLPMYLTTQIVLVALGLIAFFRIKRKP